MTLPWETVHIFISSTFNDMHAERDYLVKQVFPELREWCEKRKLRLVDIDLRWGVTEQDATSQNVVKVCLDRIDDCRPFFLCFLGQRRGWVPKEEEISATTFEDFPALTDYVKKSNSVTEMEILHALVDPLHRGRVRDPNKPGEFYEPSKYAFFYLREDSYLDQLPVDPPQLRETYTNDGVEKEEQWLEQEQQLKRWREVEIPATKRPARNYHARWETHLSTPELLLPLQCPSIDEKSIKRWQDTWQKAGVTVTGVDVEDDASQTEKANAFNKLFSTGRLTEFQSDNQPLNRVIVADLQAAIAIRFPDHTEVVGESDLQKEIDQSEQFLYSGSQGFIERGGDFDDLNTYVQNDSNQLFVLTAPGGSGKSSLLATWMYYYRTSIEGKEGHSIHFRFIGQSDRSTTVYSLLHLLLNELKEVAGKIPGEIPDDPQKLRQELPKLLEMAGEKGKTVIVLDALNQLETGLSDLAWLPYRLPHNIKLIVSFKTAESDANELLKRMQGQVVLSEVKPFENPEHRKELVNKYLEQYLKQLDQPLMEALIQSPGASNPLYLKVVLSELRVFGAFANLGEKIRSDFGETPVLAFNAVLNRLENDPVYSAIVPNEAVPLLFGLLAHARQGLSVEELSEIFIQVMGQDKQIAIDTIHLYLRQVRPFLAQREDRYDFFFESFKNAAKLRYVGVQDHERTVEEWHRILAQYFGGLPTWQQQAERKPTHRKTAELVYHQSMGKMWMDQYHTLTDFQFLEARCRSASVYNLEADYRLALSSWQGQTEQENVLVAFEEYLRLNGHVIHRYPDQLFPILYNHLTWLDAPDGSVHAICENARSSHHNWLRMVQDPRPELPLWLQSLEGHLGPVNAVVVTLDGQHVISGSSDNTLKVWDLSSGRLLRSLVGHTNSVRAVAVTPNAQRVVSGSSDNTLKVWEISSGRLVRSMEGHLGPVNAIGLISDGQQAVSGSDDHTLKVWDLMSGQTLRSLDGHTDKVNVVVLTPDGQQVISGSDDKTIKVWDLTSGQLVVSLEGHTGPVNALALTQDGRRLISVSADTNLKVWDLSDGQLLRTLYMYRGGINAVALTLDGQQVISMDSSLQVWDLDSGQLIREHWEVIGKVHSMALTPDGKQIVSGSIDNIIRVWDLSSGKILRIMAGHTDRVVAVAVTSDGLRAVSGSWDKTLKVWDLVHGSVLHSLEGHKDTVRAVALTPDGLQVISGSEDKTIKVWDLTSGELVRSLEGHKDFVRAVAVTPDGKLVISGSYDTTVKVWELATGRLIRSMEGHAFAVLGVKITFDGKQIISVSIDSTFKVWDLASGHLQRTMNLDKGSGSNIALTPDGKQMVVVGSADNLIRVMDLESGRIIRSLEGHTSPVSAVVLTPDGKKVVSGSSDKTLIVWDLANGLPLHSLIGHTQPVDDVALTSDGKKVVSGSSDNTVKVWDITIGRQLRSLEGHSAAVHAVALSPDERQIISGSDDKTIKVWELESGVLLRSLSRHDKPILAMALTPDGRHVVCGTVSNLKVWDLQTGKQTSLFEHTEEVHALAVTPDGRKVISGTDKTLKVWDLDKEQLLCTLEGHSSSVNAVSVTPDGKQAVSGSYGEILVWDLINGQLSRTLEGHSNVISAISVTHDGKQVISGSYDKTIKVWDLESGRLLRTLEGRQQFLHSFEGHSDVVHTIAVTLNGRKVVSGSSDKTLKVWDLKSGNLLLTLVGHTVAIEAVALTPDGMKAVSGAADNTLKVWDIVNGQLLQTLTGHTGAVLAVALTPDGRCAVSGSRDKTLKVWNLETGQLLTTLKGHINDVVAVALTPDGRHIVSGSTDKTIKVWDLVNGQLLHSLVEGHILPVHSVVLTSDEKQAISGSDDTTIKVWDLANGKMLRTLKGHLSNVNALVHTPDGRQVISGSSDKTIKVWDLGSGQTLRTLDGHDNDILTIALSTDGQKIVSGAADNTLKVWDITNGQLLHTLNGHRGAVLTLALTADAKSGITGSRDNTIKFWDLEYGQIKTLFVNDTDIQSLSLTSDERWLTCGDGIGRVWIFEWIHDEPKSRIAVQQQPDVVQPPDLPTLEKLATQTYAAGEYEKSLNYFNLALAQKPEDLNLLSYRVAALLKLNRYQEALDRIDFILGHNLATGVNLGLTYLGKGNALQGLKRYEEATAWYPKAIELAGNYSSVWYMQGCNLFYLNRYEQALESFHHAQAMHSDVNTRLYMGYCLMHLDRPAEAEKIYEELVAEGMHHATVYFSLAAAEKALGKRTEARSNLELFMKSATQEQQSLMLEAKQMLEDLSK